MKGLQGRRIGAPSRATAKVSMHKSARANRLARQVMHTHTHIICVAEPKPCEPSPNMAESSAHVVSLGQGWSSEPLPSPDSAKGAKVGSRAQV